LEAVSTEREAAFLSAVRRSVQLHRPWVTPPSTTKAFRAYVAKLNGKTHVGYFVCSRDGDLVGVVNLNEIVRGRFRSAYLGYYAFVPHNGKGWLTAGLAAAISAAFRSLRLHRLEANIQP
jgi:ribosomal-protein-alanine N-acetyltransferase